MLVSSRYFRFRGIAYTFLHHCTSMGSSSSRVQIPSDVEACSQIDEVQPDGPVDGHS